VPTGQTLHNADIAAVKSALLTESEHPFPT